MDNLSTGFAAMLGSNKPDQPVVPVGQEYTMFHLAYKYSRIHVIYMNIIEEFSTCTQNKTYSEIRVK